MKQFSIVNANVYHIPERGSGIVTCASLNLVVSGCVSRTVNGIEPETEYPYLALLTACDEVEFEFNEDRENWVVQLDAPGLIEKVGDSVNFVRLCMLEGEAFLVPRITHLSELLLPHFTGLFKDIVNTYLDTSPLGKSRALTKVFSILDYILDQHASSKDLSSAGRLKRLIDSDEHWNNNLDTMCEECGYSPDHMRRLFLTEFGINPHQYRHRRRISQVTRLLSETTLPISDIAHRLGFRHVSHLCMTYKKATGMTPNQARNTLRDAPLRSRQVPQTNGSDNKQS